MSLTHESSLSLRILVDRSIIEVFAADGRAVASARDYPSVDETGLRVWAANGDAAAATADGAVGGVTLESVHAWSMACGWVDTL